MRAWYNRMIHYFSKHVIWGHTIHFLAGFGIALIIQHYYAGNAFLPVWIGWICIVISLIGHIRALFD